MGMLVLLYLRIVCGMQFDEGKDRIVGGETTKKKEFPWQAAIVAGGTRIPFCGGSLINNKYILTAAHCVLDNGYKLLPNDKMGVILNAHMLEQFRAKAARNVSLGEDGSYQSAGWDQADVKEDDEIYVEVEKIVVHQFYSQFIDHDCDIALLRLKTPVAMSGAGSPTPICLPGITDDPKDYAGETATVTGWGKGHELSKATTKLLQKVEVPILPQTTCIQWYSDDELELEVSGNMICAGYEEGKKDACSGDSGGPLVLKEGNKWIQIGVVSFGAGCAGKKRPGVYARVTNFLTWIYHHTDGATWPKTP